MILAGSLDWYQKGDRGSLQKCLPWGCYQWLGHESLRGVHKTQLGALAWNLGALVPTALGTCFGSHSESSGAGWQVALSTVVPPTYWARLENIGGH